MSTIQTSRRRLRAARRLTYAFVLCAAQIGVPIRAQQAEAPTLETILAAVEAQERSILSLSVRATTEMFSKTDTENPARGSVCLRVLRQAAARGLVSIDFDPEILPTSEGRMLEDVYRVSYDGSYTFQRVESTGYEGDRRLQMDRGQVSEGISKTLTHAAMYYGWSSSIYGWFEDKEKTFSEFLRISARDTQIARTVEGLVSVTLRNPHREMSWTLDPERAYSIVEFRAMKGTRFQRRDKISRFHELRDGVFYPASIAREFFNSATGEVIVWETDVESVELDPKAAADVASFRIDYIDGDTVQDQVIGRLIGVGPSADELRARIAAQVGAVKQESREFGVFGETSAGAAEAREGASGAWWMILASFFALALGATGAWLWGTRRREPRLGASSMTMLLLVVGATIAMRAPSRSQGVAGTVVREQAANCGVATANFVTAWFRRAIDLSTIGAELQCGERWGDAVRMDHLASYLQRSGLLVEGTRGLTLDRLRSAVRDGALVVVHATKEGEGHYYCVASCDATGRLLCVDAGIRHKWLDENVASNKEVFDRFSGVGLIVRAAEEEYDLATIERMHVNFGCVARSAGEAGPLELHVPVRNSAAMSLSLRVIKASCTCFTGIRFASGESTIGARSRDELVFELDAKKIQQGASTQFAKLSLGGDGVSRELRVKMDMSLQRRGAAAPVLASLLPPRLDLGVVDCASRTVDAASEAWLVKRRVRAVLPAECNIVAVTAGDAAFAWRRAGVELVEFDGEPRHVHSFEVGIRATKEARRHGEVWRTRVRFEVDNGGGPLVLPVRATWAAR